MVRCIRDNFVAVALDKQKLLAQDRRAANAEELKQVARFTGGRTVNLGVYLTRSDGAPLADLGTVTSTSEILTALKLAIARNGAANPGPLSARPVNPDRGMGFREDGSARLALAVRFLDKSHSAGQPVFDSIIFTPADWRALAPPADGTPSYRIPEGTARKFARAVSSSSDLSFLIRPQDLETALLTGEVVADTLGDKHIRLTGKLAGRRPHVNEPDRPHHGTMSLDGLLILNSKGQPLRLLLTGQGLYQQPWMSRPASTGAVIDWHGDGDQ